MPHDLPLLDIFIVLVAAKLGDELFKRIRQPSIVGEILAGMLVGPVVFDLVHVTEILELFAELGLVFLLFHVGLETRLSEMKEVGGTAARVGVLGFVLPLGAGLAAGFAAGERLDTSLFLGAALVATSVGITAAVLLELGQAGTKVSRTILGAAVLDDILAMLLLAIASAVVAAKVSIAAIGLTLGLAVAYIALFAFGGIAFFRARPGVLTAPRFAHTPLLPAVMLCLGMAVIAERIGLATIIGAFLAGAILAETSEQKALEQQVSPFYAFFAPFFFVVIGMQLQLDELADPTALLVLAGVTVLAIVTKFAGAWAGALALGRRDATAVGIGMVPRGEVGIVVAGIGNATGALSPMLFAVIVAMSVLTTVLAPFALKRALPDTPEEDVEVRALGDHPR